MSNLGATPDLRGLDKTDVGVEAAKLNAGEPWFISEVAGLQFYDYDSRDELTGERVRPEMGDRLHLVRAPENEHDANAIEIWWRNSVRLGHLPRYKAAQVAPLIDAGAAARAYVYDPGDGEAWSLTVLVVGAAAETCWARYIEHVAWQSIGPTEAEEKRAERLKRRAERAVDYNEAKRGARLRQAVETLFKAPFDPDLPAVGERVPTSRLTGAMHCCDKTVVRIAATVGVTITRYRYSDDWVTVTPELVGALRAWARAPRGRIEIGHVYIPRIHSERRPDYAL
ncbi:MULTISPECIES: HIRAN domain-containing protein [unclassified Methylobacterium]|jgi:HIRAN domain|uniref:HIRAN domain-containing protein n=1 Tax=unclassified Methylobacterium TaxID=2615210 RepID=UPI0006B044F6|nr:HIRAN domain-containing protein [Methylobacterium sp. yr596]SFF59968.1 HIRAN domain-containing protein [Methylobacterium sp. yr596]